MAKKKPEVVADSQHETLVKWCNEADDATLATRNLAEKSRSYYDTYGQWTDAERAKLAKQKQAPTIVNRIKPKMDGLMGMEKSNRTTAKAFARTPKHEKGAQAATESIRFVLQDNGYIDKRSAAWDTLLVEGTGGVEIQVKQGKTGDFRITLEQIMWDRIIYDPHSRRKDFSDAKFLGQVVWMDYEDALALYPGAQDVLDTMQSGSSTYDDKPRWMDNTRRRVKIAELYWYKPDGDVWYASFTRGGYCKSPKISPYVNEEGETEWPYEFASLFVDREGGRYGACRQLLDIQDEINKRRSKALHLNSVRQIMLEKGAVEDVNKVRQELAKPDGVIEITPGMVFEVLKTGDMLAGQFNLLSEAKMEIDAVGYNSAASGKDMRAMSGVALRNREIAGQTEIAPMFDVLKGLDIRVYRKIWNRVKQYWTAEKWIRVTDDENTLRWVGLNKPVTQGEQILEQAKAQNAPPEILAQLEQGIAQDPAMQVVVDTANDVAQLDVDIIIADAPDTVSQQVEDFQTLGEMVKSGFQMPPLAVIEASPLSNKDKIIKMMKEAPQLSPEHQKQMEGMAEQMKTMQAEGHKLSQENQALKQDQQAEAAKLQLETQKAQAELGLQKAKQEGEAELARAKAEADFKLKKFIAEQDMAMEKMRCEHDKKMKEDSMAFEQKAAEDKMMPEEVRKSVMTNRVAEADVMPRLMEPLVAAFAQIGELMAQQIALQEQTLTAIQAPKQVSIGSIRKGADGQISGANISTTQMTVN